MLGLILQKEGMSRIFKEDGTSTPVTILKLQANVISQIKSSENEGYSSIQISSIDRTEKNVSKSRLGHFKKNNIPLKKIIKEFRVTEEELHNFEIGSEIKVDRKQSIFAISNVTNKKQVLSLDNINLLSMEKWYDLLSLKEINIEDKNLTFKPYQTFWIANKRNYRSL